MSPTHQNPEHAEPVPPPEEEGADETVAGIPLDTLPEPVQPEAPPKEREALDEAIF